MPSSKRHLRRRMKLRAERRAYRAWIQRRVDEWLAMSEEEQLALGGGFWGYWQRRSNRRGQQ